jgi:hypothetical protein
MNSPRKPGLDLFWEQADESSSSQHPLERELDERVDALARYRRLISEAQANGREDAAEILIRQYDREEQAVQQLRDALAGRRDDAG